MKAKAMKQTAIIFTYLFLLWSFLSLLLFRSSADHGPDIVGQEVFNFTLPALLAVISAIVFAIVLKKPAAFSKRCAHSFVIMVAYGVEVLVYSTLIV